jgi:sugar O-acyltransferase (sialic acid O-acetyltransferase NeuD family)
VKAVLIGGGGHARSVAEAIRAAGNLELVGVTDVAGDTGELPHLGSDDVLPDLLGRGVTAAVMGVGGVGDNRLRARLFDHARELGFALPSVVHPSAAVASDASLGDGTVVLAGAVVGAGALVGHDVIVNSGAVVEHDCVVGDHVHLATGALLGGSVRIGAGAHVGLGAAVLQGIAVGSRAIVGAGAVVVGDVPEGVTVMGVPARSS